jgi:hypothetical protein
MRSLILTLLLSSSACAPQVVHDPPSPAAVRAPPALVVTRSPIPWRSYTYPLWGLPRDLADAPLTLLNRTGMSLEAAEGDSLNAADVVIVATTVAAAYAGFVAGWDYANSHFYEQWFYGELFGGATGVVGLGAGVAVVAAYEYALVPLQVVLLRTGVDRCYFKRDATRVIIDPAASDVRERLEGSHRSTCFFPNWQLAACEVEFELAAPRSTSP